MPVSDMSDTMQNALDDISAVPSVPDEEYILTTDSQGEESTGNRVFNPIINIYGQEGQSTRQLAKEIMDIMAFEYERQGSVFA